MTNPTRQDIIDAYTAVTTLTRLAEEFTPVRVEEHKEINDLHLAVRAALPPLPHPTMAEVEWDDNEHYLAEAEHPTWGKVIMLGTTPDSKKVTLLIKTGGVVYLPCEPSQDLTLTGRRYTPTEI